MDEPSVNLCVWFCERNCAGSASHADVKWSTGQPKPPFVSDTRGVHANVMQARQDSGRKEMNTGSTHGIDVRTGTTPIRDGNGEPTLCPSVMKPRMGRQSMMPMHRRQTPAPILGCGGGNDQPCIATPRPETILASPSPAMLHVRDLGLVHQHVPQG